MPSIKERLANWIDDSLTVIKDDLGLNKTFATKDMKVEFYEDPWASTGASMGTSDEGNSLTLRFNMSNISKVYNSADDGWGQVDALVAHEVVHALQFTEMETVFSGGIDTWFIEGLATTIQGGVPFLNQHSPKSSATIPMGSTWTGDYGSAYAAVMTLHEITNGGISAIVDRLEAGDTLSQAIANTTQGNVGEFTAGVTDFTTAAEFSTWFNSSTDLNTYLDDSADFTNPIGTIAFAQGTIRSGVTTWEDVITNNTSLENGSPFNYIFPNSDSEGDKITFQIGANKGQSIELSTVDISAEGLAITSADLSTSTNAGQAIEMLDGAIERVSTVRSTFGATQNRLEYTLNNLNNVAENLTAAESRIRDTDMAKEIMNQTKQSILSQAAQVMVAQANQKPQEVLQLLG